MLKQVVASHSKGIPHPPPTKHLHTRRINQRATALKGPEGPEALRGGETKEVNYALCLTRPLKLQQSFQKSLVSEFVLSD